MKLCYFQNGLFHKCNNRFAEFYNSVYLLKNNLIHCNVSFKIKVNPCPLLTYTDSEELEWLLFSCHEAVKREDGIIFSTKTGRQVIGDWNVSLYRLFLKEAILIK